ncbi:cytochrome c oxidase assembly protein [Rhodospirillaceae bacterium SYSU D60014]|uniref:cytochrome c oxidase assembly protein n=1 Tax=Virgifigura deserti TaxID=2268457 RepID=UPI000E674EC4
MSRTTASKNLSVMAILLGVVAGMVGLAFASVPLYRLFCQVTGYGGYTQRADAAPDVVSDRLMTVRFNADVDDRLPWSFYPEQRKVTMPIGETSLAFYKAENRSSRAVTGTATFNVTPAKAGQYFAKIDCFCFTEQTLQPGQSVDMPVSFFVDPAILDDPNLDEVKTITLSYTFFEALDQPDAAPEVSSATGANDTNSAREGSVN